MLFEVKWTAMLSLRLYTRFQESWRNNEICWHFSTTSCSFRRRSCFIRRRYFIRCPVPCSSSSEFYSWATFSSHQPVNDVGILFVDDQRALHRINTQRPVTMLCWRWVEKLVGPTKLNPQWSEQTTTVIKSLDARRTLQLAFLSKEEAKGLLATQPYFWSEIWLFQTGSFPVSYLHPTRLLMIMGNRQISVNLWTSLWNPTAV